MTALLSRLWRYLLALGVNSVPALGFFAERWSIPTTLALYWLETVAVIVLIAVRIVVHRRLTRKAGHWNVGVETHTTSGGKTTVKQSTTTFLVSFLAVMIPFTSAHGLFLGLIVFLVLPDTAPDLGRLSFSDLSTGAAGIALFLAAGLAADLIGIRDRPFSWIETVGRRAQGRMIITHLTIIFGMMAMGMTGSPLGLFAVFVGLKTLVDLAALLPTKEPSPAPPRWTKSLDGLGRSKEGRTFAEEYRRGIEQDRARREANEREVERR